MAEPEAAGPPRWVDWAVRLRAIAQNGRTHADSHFDLARYEELGRIAAEIMAEQSGAAFEATRALFEAETGYATPKVDVRAVVFRDARLLFVKERADGRWSLPGGWADLGETPSESVVKEVREESGFITEAVKVLAVGATMGTNEVINLILVSVTAGQGFGFNRAFFLEASGDRLKGRLGIGPASAAEGRSQGSSKKTASAPSRAPKAPSLRSTKRSLPR